MTTEEVGPPLYEVLDVDTMAVLIRTVRWLSSRMGVPANVSKQVTSAIFAARVPLSPMLDEEGQRIGTLVEADMPALLALAHKALVERLSAAGWPTDPLKWEW